MTIMEAINTVDGLKHNTYSYCEKVQWLSRLEFIIKRQIIDTHEGWEDVVFNGYNDRTDKNTVLLVPAPYDEMYIRWLEAQIDYSNGEYNRYNNSMAMYQTAYNGYSNYYNRNNMPLGKALNYFGAVSTSNTPSKVIIDVGIEEV